jgi:hypothetical protein
MSDWSEALTAKLQGMLDTQIPKAVRGVDVAEAVTDDGDEFLVVTVRLAGETPDDETLIRAQEEIESVVAGQGERFASVRFQEAA